MPEVTGPVEGHNILYRLDAVAVKQPRFIRNVSYYTRPYISNSWTCFSTGSGTVTV